jgi:hypothetical protein
MMSLANISRASGTVDIFAHYLGFFVPRIYIMCKNMMIKENAPDILILWNYVKSRASTID